jgi:translation initiation factor IF-3
MVQKNIKNNNHFQKNKEDLLKINKEIKSEEVRLIGVNGEAFGVLSLKDALKKVSEIELSEGIELDLVEISPNANPPVCKIMNYSKYLYEKQKKEKLNKKQSKATKLKEIVIKPAIDVNDFNHKCNQARSFLEKGDKVKIMLRMSGREIQHSNDNIKKIQAFIEKLNDISKIEQALKKDRFIFHAILAPIK